MNGRASVDEPTQTDPGTWSSTVRGIATSPLGLLIVLVLVLVAVLGLRAVAELVVPVIFGLFLALLAMPAVRSLERRGFRYPVALAGASAVIVAVLVAVAIVIAFSVGELVVRVPCLRGPTAGTRGRRPRAPGAGRGLDRPGIGPGRRHPGGAPVDRPARRVGRIGCGHRDLRPGVHDDLRARGRTRPPRARGRGIRRAAPRLRGRRAVRRRPAPLPGRAGAAGPVRRRAGAHPPDRPRGAAPGALGVPRLRRQLHPDGRHDHRPRPTDDPGAPGFGRGRPRPASSSGSSSSTWRRTTCSSRG